MTDTNDEWVGERLLGARVARGWSQKELADRIGGAGARSVWRWEHSQGRPGRKYAHLLTLLFSTYPPTNPAELSRLVGHLTAELQETRALVAELQGDRKAS